MAKIRFIKSCGQYQIDYYINGKRFRKFIGSDKQQAEKEKKRVEVSIDSNKAGLELPYLASKSESNLSTNDITNPRKSPSRVAINQAIKAYLERCQDAVQSGNMTDKTYYYKQAFLNKRFLRFLAEKFPSLEYLDQIQKTHIETYRSYRLNSKHRVAKNRKISTASVNNDLRDLIAFFNYCIDNNQIFHIQNNPARKVDKIKKADISERPPCLTKDQVTQMLHKAIHDKELHCVIEAFLNTAMRYNELKNLRWLDVDFKKGLIAIKSREQFKTKSRKSRIIPMTDQMRKLLKSLSQKSDLVFDFTLIQKKKAKRDNLCNIRKRYDVIRKQLPFLKTGERFHIFRHTAITWWANSGVPLPIVQKWAGHSSVEMTMKYVHPSEDESIQWMKKMPGLTNPLTQSDQDSQA